MAQQEEGEQASVIYAATGHRPRRLRIAWPSLRVVDLGAAILDHLRPERMILGMAEGFDMGMAAACVRRGVRFDAYIPCTDQAALQRAASRAWYEDLLGRAAYEENPRPEAQREGHLRQGVCKTKKQWAKKLKRGTIRTIESRMARGWSDEKAVTAPVRKRTSVVELDGEALAICEWSLRSGVPRMRITMRLLRGWPVREAGFYPVDWQQHPDKYPRPVKAHTNPY